MSGITYPWKRKLPSVRAICTSIFIIGCDTLLTCTRLLMTSNGKIATHNEIPPTPPQTIVLKAPVIEKEFEHLILHSQTLVVYNIPISSFDFPAGVKKCRQSS